MTPAITFDDYTRIGTMETALSEHADEVFFELSAEQQKIAGKIFKCLTETDRENRETRRATTIEKLCAVAGADISEVASIIDAFRPEGRTFLMPPPEVDLNKNTLIDISHESLIRKWERLKKWVEEEGQSARTYRRLAEDALLHKQGKVGFWSEPELSDALDWRGDFEPNETWAQLYKEKGERQYRASFAESMQYLDDSKAFRDAEIAEDERQQNALRKYAVKLRRLVFALGIVLVLSLFAAAFAFYQGNAAVKAQSALNDSLEKLQVEKTDKEKAFDDLKSSKEELSDSYNKQKEATEKAEKAKKQVELSEAETVKALEEQKRLAAATKAAKDEAIKKRDEAERAKSEAIESFNRLKAATEREKLNREGLIALEYGEFDEAFNNFTKLLGDYKNIGETSSEKDKVGKWWASHNLGIISSKLNKFEDAKKFYKDALIILGETPQAEETTQSQNSKQYFQIVSYQKSDEINRSIVSTLRRLAQLYRAEADKIPDDYDFGQEQRAQDLILQAIKNYERLIEILGVKPKDIETGDTKQSSYVADVYVEFADCLCELYRCDEAENYYRDAAATYGKERNFARQVEVLEKQSAAAASRENYGNAIRLLNTVIDIRKKEMKLSPVSVELADNYDKIGEALAAAYERRASTDKSPPYYALAKLIRDFNKQGNTSSFDESVRNVANAYVQIGKCQTAAQIYSYIFDEQSKPGQDGDFSASNLPLYIDLSDLYQNVLREDENARKYYDEAVKVLKYDRYVKSLPTETAIKAGDFYFARDDYPNARKLYAKALSKIDDINKDLDYKNETDDEIKKTYLDLILIKSEILIKTARTYEREKEFEEAGKMYQEAVNFVTSRLGETNFPMTAGVLIYQADFYKETGNNKKALENYNKAETILANSIGYSVEKTTLQIHLQKKLGDMSRENVSLAAKYYENAVKYMSTIPQIPKDKEYAQYYKNNKLNAKYYSDLAEAYEAWMGLDGVQLFPEQKRKAEEARKKASELKLEEQQSPCDETNS